MSDVPTIAIFLAALSGGAALVAQGHASADTPASTVVAPAMAPGVAMAQDTGTQVITKGPDGMFYIEGDVNGAPVRFLVDTGASMMMLSKSDAERAGLDGRSQTATARTLAGTVGLRLTESDSVQVAGRTLRHVPTAVHPGQDEVSVIGLDALGRIGSVTIMRDRLVIASPKT